MKVIIIEGPDNTGKNTLIQHILDSNLIVSLIHCDKPKSNEPFLEQQKLFLSHAEKTIKESIEQKTDIVIFNRYYQGEYVYGQMYRNGDPIKIKKMVSILEDYLLNNIGYDNIYYVQLNSQSPYLLKKNDDGKSLSKADLEKIQKEIDLFNDIYKFSKLKKMKLCISDGDNFRKRENILKQFIKFIEK